MCLRASLSQSVGGAVRMVSRVTPWRHHLHGNSGYRQNLDHSRPLTTIEHMLSDFELHNTSRWNTSTSRFYGVDWNTFSPNTPPHELKSAQDEMALYRRTIDAGSEINIHFHTFTIASAIALIDAGNSEKCWNGKIEILRVCENFPGSCPNGFLIVAKVRKPLSSRLRALFANKGLLDNARKF